MSPHPKPRSFCDTISLARLSHEGYPRKEGRKMKAVKLCQEGSCCPEVKVYDSKVEIGEDDNTCVLTIEQWEILKRKVLNQEI